MAWHYTDFTKREVARTLKQVAAYTSSRTSYEKCNVRKLVRSCEYLGGFIGTTVEHGCESVVTQIYYYLALVVLVRVRELERDRGGVSIRLTGRGGKTEVGISSHDRRGESMAAVVASSFALFDTVMNYSYFPKFEEQMRSRISNLLNNPEAAFSEESVSLFASLK